MGRCQCVVLKMNIFMDINYSGFTAFYVEFLHANTVYVPCVVYEWRVHI